MNSLLNWFNRAVGLPGSGKAVRQRKAVLRDTRLESLRGSRVVIVVIDDSPSMEEKDYKPTRLKGAKKAVRRFVEKLAAEEPGTLVGLVSFHSRARLEHAPQPVGEHAEELMKSITWESTGAGTNIGDGLRVAAREIERIPEARHPRIILLTDGESNSGKDPVDVAAEVKAKGIQLDIIGIGGSPKDINEPDLKRMASVVNGQLRYWFIASVEGLVERFEALALREFI